MKRGGDEMGSGVEGRVGVEMLRSVSWFLLALCLENLVCKLSFLTSFVKAVSSTLLIQYATLSKTLQYKIVGLCAWVRLFHRIQQSKTIHHPWMVVTEELFTLFLFLKRMVTENIIEI